MQPCDANSGQALLRSWHWAWSCNKEKHCFSPGIFGEGMESWQTCVGACVLEQSLLSRGLLCPCRQWPYLLIKAHYSITGLSSHTSPRSETFLCCMERSHVSKGLVALAFKRGKLWSPPSPGHSPQNTHVFFTSYFWDLEGKMSG